MFLTSGLPRPALPGGGLLCIAGAAWATRSNEASSQDFYAYHTQGDPPSTVYLTGGTLTFESGDVVPSLMSSSYYYLDGHANAQTPNIVLMSVDSTHKTWTGSWSSSHLTTAHDVQVQISVDGGMGGTYDLLTTPAISLNCESG